MRILFASLGFMSLGLGVIGIIVPILPTTPFLILTGYLFTKSSDRYQDWFKNTKVYKKYLSNFVENKSMTKKAKWTLLLTVDIMLLISFVSIQIIALRVMIIVLVIVKHWYFHNYIEISNKN